MPLPVLELRDAILDHLAAHNRLVLTAPTGSGKTTQVPQILTHLRPLRSPPTSGGRNPPEPPEGSRARQIIVLQPRRLATRLVALRVAQEMNSPVGGLVGYQTRHDSRVSEHTVVRFMTEGLFLRQLARNPTLAGVAALVLDEFHERNVDADVALGVARQLQDTVRPDLRVVVMSATLDTQSVAQYLGCETLSASGRMFPVDVSYLRSYSQSPPWDLAVDAVADVLRSTDAGDVLVFMPGVYEIRRTMTTARARLGPNLPIHPLHGSLTAEEQDAAVTPDERGRRRVIVATNVAETSITIPGVRHVIDSGLARIARYDTRRGINLLLVEAVSQASTDQRAGRAGRTAPGTCRRLWTEAQQRARKPHELPEVQRVDLAQIFLHLQSLGVADAAAFPWLDPPAPEAVSRATNLLRQLGATDGQGSITPAGRTMARFPVHPRLGRMLVEAINRGCFDRAAMWAAIISERDITTQRGFAKFAGQQTDTPRSDLLVLEDAMRAAERERFNPRRCAERGLNAHACREVEQARRQIVASAPSQIRNQQSDTRNDPLLKCLLTAYCDHVAVRRDASSLACAMVGQKRVVLDRDTSVKRAGPVVALEVSEIGGGREEVRTVLAMASEVETDWLLELFPDRVTSTKSPRWNAERKAVEQVESLTFDGLVLDETRRPDADPVVAAQMLADKIAAGELRLERWDDAVEQWIARTRCVAAWFPERRLITYDEGDLSIVIGEIARGATRWSQVVDRPCLPALRDVLSWDDQQFVEKMAPAKIALPRGYAMKVEYRPGHPPRGRAKIQDFYGLTQTPTVAAGRVSVTLEILGPNFRPVQITDDLTGFWTNHYPTLKKELSRRYPRHEWR